MTGGEQAHLLFARGPLGEIYSIRLAIGSKPVVGESMGRPPRSNAYVVSVAASATFLGIALLAGAATAVPKKHNPYHKLNVFSRVLSYIESSYIEEVDQDELIYGAIKGMLETLDPHTTFMRP